MDADGYAVIDVCLYDNLELYNPMSMGRQRDLNPEIYDFIEQKAYIIPAWTTLKVCFRGGKLLAEEKEEIKRLLSEHYTVILHDKAWDKQINRRKLFDMAAVGVVSSRCIFFFAPKWEDGLFLEILSVIGSFALWEAADCLMLERREINTEIFNTAQYLTQEIEFIECRE